MRFKKSNCRKKMVFSQPDVVGNTRATRNAKKLHKKET